jgi:ribonuclease P protein component
MRRETRLRRSADFERVRANRSSWAHPFLICSRRQRDDQEPTRVGIIVGRRVGKAAIRNRVKRRVRELVRARYSRLRPGYDVVFIARPAAADAPFTEVAAAVDSLLGRARLWKVEHDARGDRPDS